MKIVISEKITIVASTCRRFKSTVCLLRNLSLDGALCLRDGKKCCISISSASLAVGGEHGKRHAMSMHKPKVVSDWLNLHSLGTISAFGRIANLLHASVGEFQIRCYKCTITTVTIYIVLLNM